MLRKILILFLFVNFCSSTNNIVLQDHERAWCVNWSNVSYHNSLLYDGKYDEYIVLTSSLNSAIEVVDKTKFEDVETLTIDNFNNNLKDGTTPYVENVCKVWYDLEQGRNFFYDN